MHASPYLQLRAGCSAFRHIKDYLRSFILRKQQHSHPSEGVRALSRSRVTCSLPSASMQVLRALLLVRELDERLSFGVLVEPHFADAPGKNAQLPLTDLVRQSVLRRPQRPRLRGKWRRLFGALMGKIA